MPATLPLMPNCNGQLDVAVIVRLILKFIEKAARKIVTLSANDWAHLEKLALQLKEASEPERIEIIDAIAELLFPEETIGGVLPADKGISEKAREKLDDYRKRVGEQIKAFREEGKMTQEKLAKKAGIPQSHVSRLESGKHAPTHQTIEKIAKALGVKPSQLDPGFEDEEEKRGYPSATENGQMEINASAN